MQLIIKKRENDILFVHDSQNFMYLHGLATIYTLIPCIFVVYPIRLLGNKKNTLVLLDYQTNK